MKLWNRWTRTILILLPFFTLALFVPRRNISAAGSHSSVLTWPLSPDDTTANCTAPATCSQNIYRANTGCAVANPPLTLLTSVASTATTYTDSTITPGTWCYSVTFVLSGAESVKNTTQTVVLPAPPGTVTIVSQ